MIDNKNVLLDFDKFFDNSKELQPTPGCSVCVTKGKKVLMSSGFGYKDMENKDPVDADTQFFLASNTKTFVTLCAALLVDEGKLEFTRPIKEYIPWFKLYDEYATNRITLRDVFSHQTGLPDVRVHIEMDKFSSIQEQRKEIVRKLRYIEPTCDIRTILQYNSTMYTLAAYLIGEVSGMLWEDFTTERILKPLGMNNTHFNKAKAYRTGNCSEFYYIDINNNEMKKLYHHDPNDDPDSYNPNGAGGCMTSTANDMKNFLIMFANDGRFQDKVFLSSESLKQLLDSSFAENWDGPFDELGNAAAALGWFVWGYRGHKIREHGGFYGSTIIIMPDQNIGVSIFPNLNGIYYGQALAFNIFDRLLGLDQIDWINRLAKHKKEDDKNMKELNEKAKIKKISGTTCSHALDHYSGTYENEIDDKRNIIYADGKLYLETDEPENIELKHFHYDTFHVYFQKYDYEFYINFLTDFQGRIDKLVTSDDKRIMNRVREE